MDWSVPFFYLDEKNHGAQIEALEETIREGQMLLAKQKREWKEAMEKLNELETVKTQMLDMRMAIERKTEVVEAKRHFQQLELAAKRTMEREVFRAEELSRRLSAREAELEAIREHRAQVVEAFKALREEYVEHMDEPPSVKLPKEGGGFELSDDEED